MKKMLFICAFLAVCTLSAQPGPDGEFSKRKAFKEAMKDLTPQQRAELKTKRMTLDLDLTESQQQKILRWNLENEQHWQAMKKQRDEEASLTKDQLFERKSEMLDHEIERKKELKSILTEEQYAKFEKDRGSHRMQKKRSKEHRKG